MISLSIRSKPISQLLKPTSKTQYISLFSISTLPNSPYLSPFRRYEEDSRNVRVSVWWDIENCGVPVGINVFKIASSVTNAVRVNGIKGPVQITAFGDVGCISRVNQEALSCTGVKLVHIPFGDKNSADRSLLVNLMLWVSQNPPPAHIFLISSDRDFAGILHKLRMSNYNILLASREHNQPPCVLYSAATIMWHWLELCKGKNISGKHFNHPPDGAHNSWYGHYKGPLEDPFLMAHQQKQSEDDDGSSDVAESESSTGKSKHRPIPIEVVSRIKSVINRHPKGLSIVEIRTKLKECNVHFVKDFHGYKKFSNFLQALPSIVRVEPRPYGQYFVKPALTESQISVDSDCDGDAESNAKEDGKSPTRMAEVPISPCVDEKEKTVEEKFPEETLENEASFEGSITPKEGYDSVIRHSSMDTTVKDLKLVDNADMAEKSEANPGFVSKMINWCKFKFWRNESSTDKAIEIPGKEPCFVGGDTGEFEDASPSTKLENDSSHFKKHELFTEDSFWNDLGLFFKTVRGLDIVSNSISREHFAEALQKEGLSLLQPLQATDISYLVHLLIDEKKLIKEFPTETPHFRIDHLSGEFSSSTQPELNWSSHENPKTKVSSKGHKKRPKQKKEILSDCHSLLYELLSQNPEGFNIGLFKGKFLETYGYALKHKKLGHPKLFSLLQTMPGIIVDSTHVFPVNKKATASDSDSDVCDSEWEELGSVKKSNLTKEAKSRRDENGVSEDEFSEVESSSDVKGDDNELLNVLDTWYPNKVEGNSKGHPSSAEDEFSELGEDEAFSKGRKPESEKVYKFVAETSEINKDKLFAGILDSLQDLGGKKARLRERAIPRNSISSKTT